MAVASKEMARSARAALKAVRDQLSPDALRNVSGELEELAAFFEAAERKLPTDKAYTDDLSRRRDGRKARERKPAADPVRVYPDPRRGA